LTGGAEVVWLAAVLGTLGGMIVGAIVGGALCVNCELEVIIWMLAGSVIGGIAIGVTLGLLARRFQRPGGRERAALLALGVVAFAILLGIAWVSARIGDLPWPWLLVFGVVQLMVLGILGAAGALRPQGKRQRRPEVTDRGEA
jgi:hypothetical protein